MTQNEILSLLPAWILNSKSHYLIITDLGGNYIFVNNYFKERFSFLSENFIGLPVVNSIHPEDLEKCVEATKECISKPGSVVNTTLRKPIDSSGNYLKSNWEFSLFKDKSDLPHGILCLGYDITELEQKVNIINESSKKMETIIGNITDGFYVLDRTWKFLAMNQEAESILGVRFEEIQGKVIWDYFPDSANYNYPSFFREAMNENKSVHFEEFREDLDKWFSCLVYPSEIGLTIFFKDTTKEKKVQQSLVHSENKLRALLDSSTDSNILISRDYKILCFNKTANEICKKAYGIELLENKSILDYIMAKDQTDFIRDFSKALQGEIVCLEREIKFDNFSYWTEASFFPVFDENKQVISVTYNSNNITDRKKSEEKLKESEAILSSIFNSSKDSHTLLSNDFKILYLNKEAELVSEQVFGKPAQKGDNSLDFVLPELHEEFLQSYRKVLKGESINIEKMHDDQSWLFSLFPVYNGLGELVGISKNVKNITESKKDQLKIISQNKKLKEIAWQQSHIVRKQVANILGLCHLFEVHKELSNEDKEKNISYIYKSAKELDRIIHEIVEKTEDTQYSI
jgi:PAS domain S-box-containing protein